MGIVQRRILPVRRLHDPNRRVSSITLETGVLSGEECRRLRDFTDSKAFSDRQYTLPAGLQEFTHFPISSSDVSIDLGPETTLILQAQARVLKRAQIFFQSPGILIDYTDLTRRATSELPNGDEEYLATMWAYAKDIMVEIVYGRWTLE